MRRRKLSHIVGTIVVLLFLSASSAIAVPFYQTSYSTPENPQGNNVAENEAMTPVAVPEPATIALLGLGTLVLISGRRGNRKTGDGKHLVRRNISAREELK